MPAEYAAPVLPVAVGMLVVGVVLSVLGAKLARFGIAAGFVLAGVAAASVIAPHVNWPFVAVVVLGIVIGWAFGHLLFRLWVGLGAAALCMALALGVFGSQVVLPHFLEYDPTPSFDGTFSLPDPVAPDLNIDNPDSVEQALAGVHERAEDFWLYVQSQEVDVNRHIALVGLVAGVIGLLVGSLLPRLTLIVGSSVMGTSLVMSGLAGLAARVFNIDLTRASTDHGGAILASSLVFLVASLVLQSLLTRSAPPPPRPVPEK